MNTHSDKSQDTKNQSVSAAESLKQSGSESALQFEDNRPETLAQRKMQEMADNSPQTKQAAQLQAMVDNHSTQKLPPIQKTENNFKAKSFQFADNIHEQVSRIKLLENKNSKDDFQIGMATVQMMWRPSRPQTGPEPGSVAAKIQAVEASLRSNPTPTANEINETPSQPWKWTRYLKYSIQTLSEGLLNVTCHIHYDAAKMPLPSNSYINDLEGSVFPTPLEIRNEYPLN